MRDAHIVEASIEREKKMFSTAQHVLKMSDDSFLLPLLVNEKQISFFAIYRFSISIMHMKSCYS